LNTNHELPDECIGDYALDEDRQIVPLRIAGEHNGNSCAMDQNLARIRDTEANRSGCGFGDDL